MLGGGGRGAFFFVVVWVRSENMASGAFGGGADIARACKRIGGFARNVKNQREKLSLRYTGGLNNPPPSQTSSA